MDQVRTACCPGFFPSTGSTLLRKGVTEAHQTRHPFLKGVAGLQALARDKEGSSLTFE